MAIRVASCCHIDNPLSAKYKRTSCSGSIGELVGHSVIRGQYVNVEFLGLVCKLSLGFRVGMVGINKNLCTDIG